MLATVLFTDIVGSTERAVELGDREVARAARHAHDAAVRRELERYRGVEVKTRGDDFLATFDGPARAIRCAQAIGDRGAAARHRGARRACTPVSVELRGDDIAGIAVHIGARVAALAGPGEVLVTRTVRDLVAGSGHRVRRIGAATSSRACPGSGRSWRCRVTP